MTIAPEIGGSIRSFTWRDLPIMRTSQDGSILDSACFPLVPFSNRIAHGHFEWEGLAVSISPNFPDSDHPHPLHGFGWTSQWEVIRCDPSSAELVHLFGGAEWPWPYRALQRFALSEQGLKLELSVQNLADRSMPVGLGFHPYFPCTDSTLLRAFHRGEWQTGPDSLPVELREENLAKDWWQEAPVGSRHVDTVYTQREGPLMIEWPDRNLCAVIEAEPALSFTSILVPDNVPWFCVEPVTHMTNAVNTRMAGTGLVGLAPQAIFQVGCSISAARLQ